MANQITFVRKYATSVEGIIRIILIVSLIAGWISAAAISRGYIDTSGSRRQHTYIYKSFDHFLQTRTAYIVIAVVAMFVSMVQYGVSLGNIDSLKYYRKMKFDFMFLIFDVIFMLMMFGMAVAATVREAQLTANYDQFLVKILFNVGAFASAAAFGYFSAILYLCLVVMWALDAFFSDDDDDDEVVNHNNHMPNTRSTVQFSARRNNTTQDSPRTHRSHRVEDRQHSNNNNKNQQGSSQQHQHSKSSEGTSATAAPTTGAKLKSSRSFAFETSEEIQ